MFVILNWECKVTNFSIKKQIKNIFYSFFYYVQTIILKKILHIRIFCSNFACKIAKRYLKEGERRTENKKESRNSLPCEPAGARTQDPILKRDVLYLLSY